MITIVLRVIKPQACDNSSLAGVGFTKIFRFNETKEERGTLPQSLFQPLSSVLVTAHHLSPRLDLM